MLKYIEDYPGYIDQSLAKGLVKKYLRAIDEKNQRVIKASAHQALQNQLQPLLVGVHRSKKLKHFYKIINTFGKWQAVIPIIIPSLEIKGDDYGMFLLLETTERYKAHHISFQIMSVHYEKRVTSIHKGNSSVMTVDSNHVLTRWLERESPKSLTHALSIIGKSWLSVGLYEGNINGEASLALLNGAMLLGTFDNDKHEFVAKTYITNSMIMTHNLENCLNPELLANLASKKAEASI